MRVGILGAGRIGSLHAGILSNHAGTDDLIVGDVDEERAKALAEEIGAGHELEVVLHPHLGTVIERPERVWRFLEGCETGLCLDTGHIMVGGGEPVEIVEQAAERVRHVHLKDVDRRRSRSPMESLAMRRSSGAGYSNRSVMGTWTSSGCWSCSKEWGTRAGMCLSRM